MNKGFLTLAQNGTNDYVRMAYVLAMSLKLTQGIDTKLSVIVNEGEPINEKYLPYFDKIIEVPFVEEEWKIQNKCKYFDLTPYDQTIVLDADMIFLNNHQWWWEAIDAYDILFTAIVDNYKGEQVTSDYYRKVFTDNNLPNLYTGLFYFRKTKEIENYFALVKIIFENWKEYYNQILKNPPDFLSGDVAYAIAAKIMFQLRFEHLAFFLRFVHMRSRLQNAGITSNWTKSLRADFSQYGDVLTLKINNISQEFPFHYIKKEFLTDEVVNIYEENMLRLLR